MILMIRIVGLTGINEEIENTLYRLRLRRKYACVLLPETAEILGMVKKLENFSAYGKADKEMLKELIIKRGRSPGDKAIKVDAGKIVDELMSGKKKLEDFGIKPFFRLSPPKGGLKSSKKHYPKGVLGNHNDKINDLLRRML